MANKVIVMDPKINGYQVFLDLLFLNKYQNIRNIRGATSNKGPLERFQNPKINIPNIKAEKDIIFSNMDFLSKPRQVKNARVIKIVAKGSALPAPISKRASTPVFCVKVCPRIITSDGKKRKIKAKTDVRYILETATKLNIL